MSIRDSVVLVRIHTSLHIQKPSNSFFCLSDLGWDSWVIHPLSLTILTCALCDPQGNVVQCPSSQSSTLDANLQVGFQPKSDRVAATWLITCNSMTQRAETDPLIIVLKCICVFVGFGFFFFWIIIHPSRVWQQSAVLLHLLLCQNSCQGIIYLFFICQTKHTLAGVSSDAAWGGSAAGDRFQIKRRWQNSRSAFVWLVNVNSPTCDLTWSPPSSPTVASWPPRRWCRSSTWTSSPASPWPPCSCPATANVDAATWDRPAWSNVCLALLSMWPKHNILTSICWLVSSVV